MSAMISLHTSERTRVTKDVTQMARRSFPSLPPGMLLILCVLGAALFVVLWKGYPDATEKWAMGLIVLIVGRYLPGNKA